MDRKSANFRQRSLELFVSYRVPFQCPRSPEFPTCNYCPPYDPINDDTHEEDRGRIDPKNRYFGDFRRLLSCTYRSVHS